MNQVDVDDGERDFSIAEYQARGLQGQVGAHTALMRLRAPSALRGSGSWGDVGAAGSGEKWQSPYLSKIGIFICSPFLSAEACATIPGTLIAKASYTFTDGSRSSKIALINSAEMNTALPPC